MNYFYYLIKSINAEVMGSNPVEALIFFRLLLSNCLIWKIYCDDHSLLSSTNHSSNMNYFIYFTSVINMYIMWSLVWAKKTVNDLFLILEEEYSELNFVSNILLTWDKPTASELC